MPMTGSPRNSMPDVLTQIVVEGVCRLVVLIFTYLALSGRTLERTSELALVLTGYSTEYFRDA